MQSLLNSIGAVLAMFALFGLALWASTRRSSALGEGTEWRRRALVQFRQYRSVAQSGESMIDGSEASIVAESESGVFRAGHVHSYSLTLLGRTPRKEYFMFVFNQDGHPFVKVLADGEANRMRKRMRPYVGDA